MRQNLPVTQRERTFPAEERLISTTDLSSKITYCNDAFVEISGFTREELIGQPHNLVRHPDMPPGVFGHMWDTIKQGKPWMGIVKNRRKNGDHYWVNAYVTPVLDAARNVTGYESVRTQPTREQVGRAEALYARLNAGKRGIPLIDRWVPLLLNWLPFILISQVGFAIGVWFNHGPGFAVAALLSIPLGLAGLHWQQRGMKRLLGLARQTTSDPLIARMYTDSMAISSWASTPLLSVYMRAISGSLVVCRASPSRRFIPRCCQC
ncbi:MAG: PAS domain-containing protein, partial [Betaproteobacteria bacterium]|nr:PAS domain-containing protein [Betaproteobacteria bacterium]